MAATILVVTLCAHLLCFSIMFLLISQRLHGKKMGMDLFALGNLLLGLAYVLQLAEEGPAWSLMSVVNHTLTLASPVVYGLAAMRFFGFSAPLWRPLLAFAAAYVLAQLLVQWSLGTVARYAMLSGLSALLFLALTLAVLRAMRTFARDLYGEMLFFGLLIGGLCVLNALKFMHLLDSGLEALSMSGNLQLVFYVYMSFLATVLPPSIIWLVLRRLTDELRQQAARDPLTQLLNRRGLSQALQRHFKAHPTTPAHLLMIDVDHFKHINDSHGHQTGDHVLCHVAQLLRIPGAGTDLVARLGGEEFVALCLNTHARGAMQVAERLRTAIEQQALPLPGAEPPLRCTVTIGISHAFTGAAALEDAMSAADVALYRGKAAGRNRVERAEQAQHVTPVRDTGLAPLSRPASIG